MIRIRVQLGCFDPDNRGVLTVAQLEDFLEHFSRAIPSLEDMPVGGRWIGRWPVGGRWGPVGGHWGPVGGHWIGQRSKGIIQPLRRVYVSLRLESNDCSMPE